MAIGRTGLLAALESATNVASDAGGDPDDRISQYLHEVESEKARAEHLRQLRPKVVEILRSLDAEKKKLAAADLWKQRRQLIGRRRAQTRELAESEGSISASKMMAFRRDTRKQSVDLLANVDRDKLRGLREGCTRELRRLVLSRPMSCQGLRCCERRTCRQIS
jgi:hypothetical protein